MKNLCRFVGVALLCLSFNVYASGGGGGGGAGPKATAPPKDPVIANAQALIANKDWDQTMQLLSKALAEKSDNADYHNLYAFSMRHSAKPDMDKVFHHYAEALRIDPKHRGAHEYLGEAYLQIGNLPKAREQLEILDKLCFFPCEEYSDLKEAVARYESARRQ